MIEKNSEYALPLSYRGLEIAQAIKLGSPVHLTSFSSMIRAGVLRTLFQGSYNVSGLIFKDFSRTFQESFLKLKDFKIRV